MRTLFSRCRPSAGWTAAIFLMALRMRHVTAEGRERNLFEHSLVVRLRREGGRIHRQKAETAFMRRWTTSFDYPAAPRQDGTLEAVALSAKDGTLDCLVQVRVRMGGS